MKKIISSLVIAAISLSVISDVNAIYRGGKRRRGRAMSTPVTPVEKQNVKQKLAAATKDALDPNMPMAEKKEAAKEIQSAIQYSPEILKLAELLTKKKAKEDEIQAKKDSIATMQPGLFSFFDSKEIKDAKLELQRLREELKEIIAQINPQAEVVDSIFNKGTAKLVAAAVGTLAIVYGGYKVYAMGPEGRAAMMEAAKGYGEAVYEMLPDVRGRLKRGAARVQGLFGGTPAETVTVPGTSTPVVPTESAQVQ